MLRQTSVSSSGAGHTFGAVFELVIQNGIMYEHTKAMNGAK